MASSIAITGYGIISAIGNDAQSTLRSLLDGRSGIGAMKYLKSVHTHLPVGEVQLSNAEMKRVLCVDESEVVSRNVLLGAIALREAMSNAGIDNPGNNKKVVFISGTTVGGMDITEDLFSKMMTDDSTLQYLDKHDCGSSSHEIAEICHINADVCTISTACSSALNAIILGAEMLKRGDADIVIAGGCESLSKFHFNGFNSLMILDSKPCRPFDATRAGINLGEGAAYVVMERSEDATKRGAKIDAYVSGFGNRCDAFHQTATSETGEGAFLAMSDALQSAGLSADDITYVNAHGTGTGNNDQSEAVALKRVFGKRVPRVSSTKGFTGHTTSASGSIEAVICMLAMKYRFIPANVGWSVPMADDGIIPSQGECDVMLDHVLCNSFGFGGNCSSVILSSRPVTSTDSEAHIPCRIVAETIVDNIDALVELKEFISPLETRRMGKLLKAATLSALKALKKADIAAPDAIITATRLGMLETSEKFLRSMVEDGEEALSPTLFMQSTHNTVSSAIAIRTKSHGYNVTYTQGDDSLRWAKYDARNLIKEGKAKNVLVIEFDETTSLYNEFLRRRNQVERCNVYSKSIVFSAE